MLPTRVIETHLFGRVLCDEQILSSLLEKITNVVGGMGFGRDSKPS